MPRIEKLGVIAGRGDLPLEIARSAAKNGVEVHVFVLRGQGDPETFLTEFPTQVIRMGAGKASIETVRNAGIRDLVFAGGVRRPSFLELRPDATAARVLGRGLMKMGDDGLLTAIVKYLEETEGFRIHPIHEILSDACPPPGPLADVPVPPEAEADIARGRAVLASLAEADVGQAIAVQDGLILAVEAIEGTDAMIRRSADLKRDGRGPVLIKMAKRQQTDQADLPTVGPDTIRNAALAGFSGVAVEGDRTIVVDASACADVAKAKGLFFVALPPEGRDE